MPRITPSRALALAALVVVLAPAVWHVRTLAWILGERLHYPMDLEWMESGHLYQAYRVANGLPLYVDPGTGFAPFPYPPLFWIVIAAASKIVGLDYGTGRAISVLSLGGSIAILSLAIARRAPARWIGVAFGLVAAASVCAGYPFTEGSYDLVRSDTFATFVPIVAAALVGDGRITRGRGIAIAIALTASLYTKQTDVFFVAWLVVFVAMTSRRRGVELAVATVALGGALLVVAQVVTGGWFWIWLFDMSHHAIDAERWADPFAPFIRHAPFLVFVPLLVGWLRWNRALSPGSVKWVGMLGAAIGSALLAHVKRGGWYNVYVPVFVLAWPVTLYLTCDALRLLWSRPRAAIIATWTTLVIAGAILQLHAYHTEAFVPIASDRREAQRVHDLVRSLDGEVVITINAFVAIRAGKQCPQPMLQAYFDAANAKVAVDYPSALDRSGARWIITSGLEFEGDLPAKLERSFERRQSLDVHILRGHPDRLELWERRQGP